MLSSLVCTVTRESSIPISLSLPDTSWARLATPPRPKSFTALRRL